VRWSRKAGFENSDYLFTVNVEGGVRLWLDGRMLIDDWVASGNRTLTAQSGVIKAGDHDLRVDYFKSGGVGRINVNWAPIAAAAPVAVIDVPGQITVGQPAQFSGQRSAAADGRKIVTYQWDFGDGAGSNDVNPVYTYNKAGNYTVSLTVIDDLGQEGEAKVDVTVQAPAPPVAVIGGPMSGMVGDTLAYSGADSHGSLPIVRYEWDFGDGQTAAGVRVNHAYQNAGAYRVMLTVTDEAGQQGASTLDVTISGVPPTETPVPQPTVGPTPTPPGQEILGAWSMTGRAQGRQAPIELLPGTQITLVLAADGTYSGNGGCNTYQGTYQLLGPDQIQFGAMSQSQKVCDQPIMAQETDYFTSLLKAKAFSVNGSKMQLNTSDNWTLFYDRAP
jgi:heat shock protein HslJ/chitodextrinase